MRLHHLLKRLFIQQQNAGLTVQIVRHRQRIGADRLHVFFQIGFCNSLRFIHRSAHAFTKPCLYTEIEKHRREDGHDHGWGRGQKSKNIHQTYMQM